MPLGGSRPARAPTADDLATLARYPFVVASWVADDGFPTSVATDFEIDPGRGIVTLRLPAGDGVSIPTDRQLSIVGSHIRPKPGEGYDERRYLQLWGTGEPPTAGRLAFRPTRAWGWDEAEVPFFEYSERSVPQSRYYLAQLSAERGHPVRPRLAFGWLALRTMRLPFLSATVVPVLLGIAIAARQGAFDPWLALLTLVGACFAHLGTNVANDVFDTLSGADEANVNPTQYSGGSRVVIYDLVTIRQLAVLAGGLYVGAVAIGLLLVWLTASPTLLWIGILGIGVGIAYTAPPLKLVYRGVGELAVGIGFGLLVVGASVVQTRTLSAEALVAAVPMAILVALILYVNEIPDRSGDAAAGKGTLPVRLSPATVQLGYLVAALAAFAVIVGGVVAGLLPWPTLVALAGLPLVLRVHAGIRTHYHSPYTLMAVMGTNINLTLLVGALLLAGYVAWIVGSALLGA